MQQRSWPWAVLVVLFALSLSSFAGMGAVAGPAPTEGSVLIHHQRGSFDPLVGMPAPLPGVDSAALPTTGTAYYLVQFRGPILPEWRSELERAGGRIVDYLPEFSYLVALDAGAVDPVQALDDVRWLGAYEPSLRLSTALDSVVTGAAPGQIVRLVVRSFPGEAASDLTAELKALGAELRAVGEDTGGGALCQIEIPAGRVRDVARLRAVAWVAPWAEPRLHNEITRSGLIFDKDQVEADLGLYGAGQVVVVGDTGVSTGDTDTMHPDFQGHFYKGSWGSGTCNSWADYYAHGTHVAGSVLGSGVMDGASPGGHDYAGSNAGVAPEASLWAWGFCSDWSGLPDSNPYQNYYGQMYYDGPAVRINTNSWGYDTIAGTYDSFSRETDRFVWDHPDMVVLFSASNDGTDGNADGIVDLGSLGVPAGAKNIITVGASENYRMTGGYNPGGPCSTWGGCWPYDYPANPIRDDRLSDDPAGMVAFSSRGPTLDGRLKPDIVAPGSNVLSTRHPAGSGDPLWGAYNDWYSYCGGTSMSTPLAAGASAIVREFYLSTYGLNPSVALVKATLINGAQDMAPGQYRDVVPDGTKDDVVRRPDNNQGWGRIDLASSLIYTLPHTLWFEDEAPPLATGGEYLATFTITGDAHPFRVSLAWSDYPGIEATHGALVNDLDLEVIGPGGISYRGNDIVGDGLLDGDIDHVNNVEGVDLNPVPGTYSVYVRGYNVPQGPQPFALVVTGDMGAAGHLNGTVYDGTLGGTLEAASVVAVSGTFEFDTITDASGAYTMPVAADTYSVSAWKYGYGLETVQDVPVVNGSVTTQDLVLEQTASHELTGCVTDLVTAQPLAAEVSVLGPFGDLVDQTATSQTTGCYAFTLFGGPYTVRAEAQLHLPAAAGVDLVADTVQDFALEATTTEGLLWGQVTNLSSGAPVEGATVEAMPGGLAATSGPDGGYELLLAPGTYNVTASAPLYSAVEEEGVVVLQSNLVRRDYALPTAHMVLQPTDGLQASLRAGEQVTRTLLIANEGQGGLDFSISEHDEGFEPAQAGAGVLVVNRDAGSDADAVEAALASLGHSYVEVGEVTFRAMPIADLLGYDLLVWVGGTGNLGPDNANEVHLMEYMDAGGSILHSDNDLGYFRHGSTYYDHYLQAIYGLDDATDTDSSPQLIQGLDLMAPLLVDLTIEPYPDGLAPRDAGAVPLFSALGASDPEYPWLGLAIDGPTYRAIYFSFDFQYVLGVDAQRELVQRAYDWLAQRDVPWLAEDIVAGTILPGDSVPVVVSFEPDLQDLPGTYRASLRIASNDPLAQPLVDYPIAMDLLPPLPVLSITKEAAVERIEVGLPLVYTLTVGNDGGLATGLVITDSVPPGTAFAWADSGGTQAAGEVVWVQPALPAGSALQVSYAVTVSCLLSGTLIVDDGHQVVATEWPTPTLGTPVQVTAVEEGATAALAYGPMPVLLDRPVGFANLSVNATSFNWSFGDGSRSAEAEPVHTYDGDTGPHTVVLTATNVCNQDVVSELLSVEDYAVELAPAAASAGAVSGQNVTYTLQVSNTGTLPDVLDLTLVDATWPTALSSDTLELTAGQTQVVSVTVSVPSGTPGGATETVVVVARSLSDPRLPAASAQAELSTTSLPVYSVELGPPYSEQSASGVGEILTYTLRVTNTSNVLDTITFSRVEPGWPTTFSTPVRTIAAGGWRLVEVYVAVPEGASRTSPDVAQIRAAGSGSAATVTLTTRLARARVYLPLVVRNGPANGR